MTSKSIGPTKSYMFAAIAALIIGTSAFVLGLNTQTASRCRIQHFTGT